MQYDILSFIDSKAIRENIIKINHTFSPAEQAVILDRSIYKSSYEKLGALEYLYGKYTDKNFGDDKLARAPYKSEGLTFSQVLKDHIDGQKELLAHMNDHTGCAFKAFASQGDNDLLYEAEFDSFKESYEYIKTLKAKYGSDPASGSYHILSWRIGIRPRKYNAYYSYDCDLKLYNAMFVPRDESEREKELRLNNCDVYIPIPFKDGDMIKDIEREMTGRKSYVYESFTAMYKRFCERPEFNTRLANKMYESGKYWLGYDLCDEKYKPQV